MVFFYYVILPDLNAVSIAFLGKLLDYIYFVLFPYILAEVSFYFNYLVSVTAEGPVSPKGHV